jgi:2,4-dienoyl-CoA reductase (NADPH2)
MPSLTKLFEPIAIGRLTLKNRIIMPAVTTLYDLEGGRRYADFYAARARGGASLFIINLQALYPGRAGVSGAVPDESVRVKGPLKINHDLYIPRLRELTAAIQENGGRACAQLAVYGFWARGGYGQPAEEVSPSGVRLQGPQYRPDLENLSFIRGGRPLAVEEIAMIAAEVGRAAERAVAAGFDAIELQALGGNLLSRFLSPLTNRRTDAYGGSLENRSRMLVETVAAIRGRVGEGVPLICRLNGDDLLPGGMGVADYQALVPILERAGVQALNLMPGWYETRRPVNQMCVPRGAFVYAAEGLKKVAKIPVAANIRITDPRLAEEILARGQADLIAVCSALMADPEWPLKAAAGRLDDIRRCTACCNCWSDLAGSRRPIGCSVNAQMGMESRYAIRRAERPKNVWVAGGGPAGMEAARVAAERGHRVTLFERRGKLGGQLRFADLPPHKGEWRHFIAWQKRALQNHGVAIRLGCELTAAEILAGRPDALIVATGARSLIPPIPGVDGPNVATCVAVLSGRQPCGRRVVVIGGGAVGCETAEFLHAKGCEVTIVEMLPQIAPDVDFWNRWVLVDRLDAAGIRQLVGTRAVAIEGEGVRIAAAGQERLLPAETVVLAAGARAYNPLAAGLAGKFEAVRFIGDCDTPQKVRQAVDAGFRAGMAV